MKRITPLLLLLTALPAAAVDPSRLVALARSTVQAEVLGTVSPTPDRREPARPVFVTIERNGRVLGCRGSLETRTASLDEEIIRAAQAAARHDPRYRPLTPGDLPGMKVTVTVVERLEPVDSVESLSPADGLVLRSGNRSGIVLPWEGRDPRVRLGWAHRKAGVPSGAPVRLYRMKAERYRG